MIECDVLIVGGGLAGYSAAMELKRLGSKDVVVVERMSGPHYERYHRICGEAVSDRVMRMSHIPDDCVVSRVDTLEISTEEGTCASIPVSGAIIDRNLLLSYMRKECGARTVHDSITSVREDGDGFVAVGTDEEYRCRYLIGADGAFSIVRKCIFGTKPVISMAAVNNIVERDCDGHTLRFIVSEKYNGTYRWEFPSKDGCMSIGYIKGLDDIDGYRERGARFIVTGKADEVVDGNCCIVGDAASLANALCCGGIGAALLSGIKAAEAISGDDMQSYRKWIERDVMFDGHYLKAMRTFSGWNEDEIEDAIRPFRKKYSILRGAYAMLRRPRWSNVYLATWIALHRGW